MLVERGDPLEELGRRKDLEDVIGRLFDIKINVGIDGRSALKIETHVPDQIIAGFDVLVRKPVRWGVVCYPTALWFVCHHLGCNHIIRDLGTSTSQTTPAWHPTQHPTNRCGSIRRKRGRPDFPKRYPESVRFRYKVVCDFTGKGGRYDLDCSSSAKIVWPPTHLPPPTDSQYTGAPDSTALCKTHSMSLI